MARWPFGVALTSWSYMWRTTPVHRRLDEGSPDEHHAPPLPPGVSATGVQQPRDGAGPLLHRRYGARIRGSRLTAEALIEALGANPDRVAPGGLATFEKTAGRAGRMAVGDEWLVRMPGPWNGPVRVVDVTPVSFRFATLDGHLEAGQIEWHAQGDRADLLFGIESWARSGDRLSDLLHNRFLMAREVQLHMWISVIERTARLCGGRLVNGIEVDTRRSTDPHRA